MPTVTTATACNVVPFARRGRVEGLDVETLAKLMPLQRVRVRAGHALVRAGEPFTALYVIHAGFFKTNVAAADGRERTTGFRMRGDVLGADAIGTDRAPADLIALEDSEVWVLPYPEVLVACARAPEIQAGLAAALAIELREDRHWMLALGTLSAESRVAAFLIDLGRRHGALGYSAVHFVLRMTRAEIGSFLGLKLETVTRCLTHLVERGVLEVQRREIRILDGIALRALAGVEELAA